MKRAVFLTFCVLPVGIVTCLDGSSHFRGEHVNSTTFSLLQPFFLQNGTKLSKIACAIQCLEIMFCLSFVSDEQIGCKLYSVNTENVSGFKSGTVRIYQRQASCEDLGYTSLQTTRKCMKLYQKELSWIEANGTCVSAGGKLFGITTAAILEEVLSLTSPTEIFIDGNDKDQESSWMYLDGSPISFLPWESKQPQGGTAQNCLLVVDGKYHDAPCENYFSGFICERNFVILQVF